MRSHDKGAMERKLVVFAYPQIEYQANYACTWLPYSVLYLADALRDQGLVDVLVYDANIRQEVRFEDLVRANAERLLAVGFSVMTGGAQIKSALEMAEVARRWAPSAVRMFGGPHANVLPGQTCRHPLVDIVTVGPGQFILPKVVAALLVGRPPRAIPGVWTKSESGEVVAPVPFSQTWEADGLHHWECVDAGPYVRSDDLLGARTLNYISSFGCAYRCRFCYEQNYGRKYHAIPAEKVLADVQGLIRRHGLTGMKFYDADFFINQKRAERIWQGLADETPVAWAASIHPNDVLRFVQGDRDAMKKMAESGCRRLLMGVESGDERVLTQVVDKRTTPGRIFEAACQIDAAGIRGAYTFILGFPGETAEEKKHTVEFAMRLAALPTSPEVRFHGFAPFPGTPMYQDALNAGFAEPGDLEEWSAFDYYGMPTPWLTDEDRGVIEDWSKSTGRRLVEKRKAA